MKPFNLKSALNGKYCETLKGHKVRLVIDRRSLDGPTCNLPPIIGYVWDPESGLWSHNFDSWTESGKCAYTDNEHPLDIIGMWEDKSDEVTITVPRPLKEARDGEDAWSWTVSNGALTPLKVNFNRRAIIYKACLESGLLFETEGDVRKFLGAMKSSR